MYIDKLDLQDHPDHLDHIDDLDDLDHLDYLDHLNHLDPSDHLDDIDSKIYHEDKCRIHIVYLVLFPQPICRGTSLRLLDSGTQAVIEVVFVDFNIIWGGSLTVWFIGIARILIQSGLEVEEGSKSISFLFTTALCIKH